MKNTLILIFLTIAGVLSAQSHKINGNVLDKENTPLIGATIVVLDQDTTMIAFGITDDFGNYEIYDVPTGNQILQVSYTGYTDHSQVIKMEGDDEINLGQTVLEVSSQILEEVSIKAEHIPMGIIGDTINYNAAAFKTRPGASVEDLLKRLPGIEVGRDGSIKAQGKDVQNVLVDGKAFFSGDVTLATKNLEAEAVDKVQVYDKKSEEAEFTGVDDGQEEKTINLKLKDGYKNGGFGKASVEGGNEDTRQAKLNYNRFGPSIQASIIANNNNINKQAFSFNDYVDFMGGFQNVMAAGSLAEYGPSAQNRQGGSGISDQTSIGSNLNLELSKKVKMNGNYLFANNNNNTNLTGTTQNYLSNEAFTTIDTSKSINKTNNHRLNTKVKYNPNPMNAFTWNVKMFTIGNDNISDASTLYLLESLATNSTSNNLNSNARSLSLASDILYKKKFQTKGRNLLSRAKYEHITRDETTDIDNTISSMSIDERILQLQEFNNLRIVASGSLDYTEPIGNKMYLGLQYSFRDEDQTPERIYSEKKGTQLNKLEELSSLFNKSWTSHSVGLSIKRNRKRFKLNFEVNYIHADLVASERGEILNQNQKYNYLLPSGSAKFTFRGGKSLHINYSTNVSSPSLAQMVTQVNNLNPNTIILGNPNLNPEYAHSFSLEYNHFDSFNFSSLFWNFRASLSPNKIVNSRTINEDFVTEILPINVQNHQSYSGYFNHSSPIRKLKIKYSVNSRLTYDRYKTLINAEQSDVSSAMGSLGLSIENRNKDIFDIKGGANIDLSAYSNDFNSNFDDPFLNYSLYLDGFIDFGKGWSVGSKFDYLTYNGGLFTEDQVQQLWNANLSKSFLSNKLTIKVTAHDMLNQNNGINRSGGINTLSDGRFNTLGRYVMVGVSYRLGITKSNGLDIQ
jgi:hypothetical protein